MAGEDYGAATARLAQQLEGLRSNAAPAEWLAIVLGNLLELHLDNEQPERAQAVLGELGALRRPDQPGVEAQWYVGSAVFALHGGQLERGAWFAEGGVALARKHRRDDYLPHALLSLARCLSLIDRDEEARWARIEAQERFEQTGQPAHAACALFGLVGGLPPGEEREVLVRVVDLAERGKSWPVKCLALMSLGEWHQDRDQYLPATRAFDQALELARATEDATGVSICLSELSSLERSAFRHDEAVRLATEALAAAVTPVWKAWALRAREAALGGLHRHREAREDLLEAARCFEAAGDPSSAKHSRVLALEHSIYAFLHRFPRWVYRPADLSSREAAARTYFQPLLVWVGTLGLGSMAYLTWSSVKLAAEEENGVWVSLLVVPSLVFWPLLGSGIIQVMRARNRKKERAS